MASRRATHQRTLQLDNDLTVSTHKSIIKTLGRQYTDAVQFFVELVVNSWMWGEATRVEIRIPEGGDEVEYEEWGNGMDLEALREFLTKGKTTQSGFSPKYKRPVRESYGLGSLGWLSLGKELELQVHRGRFDRTIQLSEGLIDRHWDPTDQSTWKPVRVIRTPMVHDGIRLRIHGLTKLLTPTDVRRSILSRANILALQGFGPFEVFVNGEKVKPEELRGATLLPVNVSTEYGRITGEILILPVSKVRSGLTEAGINVQQKHVTCLQHQFFGLDHYRMHGLARVQGWVNADFLRRLPSSSEFERDTAQWRVFERAMRNVMKDRVYKFLRQTANRGELRSIQHLNREIAERLRRSLRRNLRLVVRSMKRAAKSRQGPRRTSREPAESSKGEAGKDGKHRGSTRNVVRISDYALAFDVAHGGDRGQAYVETDKNGVRTVFVNMDHPMWYVESRISPTKLRHCIRQILERSIAEGILPGSPATPEEAFTLLDSLYNDAVA